MLKKELGVFDVFSLAAGTMISSGLFVLPGLAYAKAGPAAILSYGLAGLLVIPLLLSQCELATAMPKSGGSYFFVERSLGPLMGTIAGLANWLSIALKATFAAIGMAAMIELFTSNASYWEVKIAAILISLVFMITNLLSVKGSGRFQSLLVIGLLIILGLYIGRGFQSGNVQVSNFDNFMGKGTQSMFAVAGMVFISFGGISKVVSVSQEVKESNKALPIGMLAAFVVVTILYILVVFITIGVLDGNELAGSLVPIKLGGKAIMGNWGVILIGAAAFMAFATTANAGILSASRTPMAMSRDGLLPEAFSKISKKFGTPYISLLLTFIFIAVVIAALDIEDLVKTASTMMILMFLLANLSVIIMRHSGMQSYRPTFKAPLTPWMQIVTIIIYIFLIVEMGYTPIAITAGFALLAVVWYLVYVQRKIDRESAFVYLVKRIVSRHITRSGLEEELKQIAIERDEITFDRFDELVQNCSILDIEEKVSAKEFFRKIAGQLCSKIGETDDQLYKQFLDRERESTTVIKPGLAIPHIVVEGESMFEILLARCKEGVVFSELQEPVKTIFVLIGSSDERNYHLRALMNIAHIVSEEDFEKRWFAATNTEQLRDIVLLSSRKREK